MVSEPYSKADIITALGVQADSLYTFFMGVPPTQFSVGSDLRWSPAQHAQHLVQTMSPLASVLQWPALVRALQRVRPMAERARAPGWTKATSEARTYTEIRSDYQEVLRLGGQAPERYLPRLNARRSQPELARSVQVSILSLQGTVRGWDENQLDTLLLPHPLMGLLSVREMLLFMLYHNGHHVTGVQRLLS